MSPLEFKITGVDCIIDGEIRRIPILFGKNISYLELCLYLNYDRLVNNHRYIGNM